MVEEIKQGLEVDIRETADDAQKVNELKYTLNTASGNVTEVLTDEIEGELKCIMLSSNSNANITIAMEDYPEMPIVDFNNFSSSMYFTPKKDSFNDKMERFNFAPEKWVLKDRLSIKIEGAPETEVVIVFRY